MNADDKQVAGDHYKLKGDSFCEHWNYVIANDLDYFQAQITKYVTRWKKKNGLVDLKKAQHFLEKYIEVHTPKQDKEFENTNLELFDDNDVASKPTSRYTNQG